MKKIRRSIGTRQSLSTILVTAFALVPLTACGGDDDDDDGEIIGGTAASGNPTPGTMGTAASTGVVTGSGGAGTGVAGPGSGGLPAGTQQPGSGGTNGSATAAPASGGQQTLTITPTGLPDLQASSVIDGQLGCPGVLPREQVGFEPCTDQAVMVKRLAVGIRKPAASRIPAVEGTYPEPTAPIVRSEQTAPAPMSGRGT